MNYLWQNLLKVFLPPAKTPAEMLQQQLAAAERERVYAESELESATIYLELQCRRIARIKNQLLESA